MGNIRTPVQRGLAQGVGAAQYPRGGDGTEGGPMNSRDFAAGKEGLESLRKIATEQVSGRE